MGLKASAVENGLEWVSVFMMSLSGTHASLKPETETSTHEKDVVFGTESSDLETDGSQVEYSECCFV